MVYTPRTLWQLAGLTVGGSALQVTADVGGSVAADLGGAAVCGRGMLQFERTDPSDPDYCVVYCLPQGLCEGHLQMGQMKGLQITGQGNCIRKGFAQLAELDARSQRVAAWARRFQGCEQMQALQFQRPAGFLAPAGPAPGEEPRGRPGANVAPVETVCGDGGLRPYRYTRRGSSACLLYCVPPGACEQMAAKGMIPGLQITARGGCLGKGFTEQVELDTWSSHLFEHGPCRGMSLMKFERGADPGTDPEPKPEPLPPDEGSAAVPDPKLEPEPELPPDEEAATTPEQKSPEPQPELPGEGVDATPELKPEPEPSLICKEGQMPYVALTRYNGLDMCSVFCVPEGLCRSNADNGDLIHLGITSPGTCSDRGFDVPVGAVAEGSARSGAGWASTWLGALRVTCRGMTVLGTFLAPVRNVNKPQNPAQRISMPQVES